MTSIPSSCVPISRISPWHPSHLCLPFHRQTQLKLVDTDPLSPLRHGMTLILNFCVQIYHIFPQHLSLRVPRLPLGTMDFLSPFNPPSYLYTVTRHSARTGRMISFASYNMSSSSSISVIRYEELNCTTISFILTQLISATWCHWGCAPIQGCRHHFPYWMGEKPMLSSELNYEIQHRNNSLYHQLLLASRFVSALVAPCYDYCVQSTHITSWRPSVFIVET